MPEIPWRNQGTGGVANILSILPVALPDEIFGALDLPVNVTVVSGMPRPYTILSVAWEYGHPDLLAVRREVFVMEQGVPEEIEIDEQDSVSLHFLAVDLKGVPIGTARLLPDGRVGRMAVLAPWRRCGVGRSLMGVVIDAARRRGESGLRLHAQVHSIPFYESLGFAVDGEEFEEAGIPHREMHCYFSEA